MTTTSDLNVESAGQVFVDPTAYADESRFHAATTLLRRESPVHWVDGGDTYRPFNLPVLTLTRDGVSHVSCFFDLRLFRTFGLPESLPVAADTP